VSAGPWRTSGAWWESQVWDRDEWDVALADSVTYRLFHERRRSEWGGFREHQSPGAADPPCRWFIEGIVD
jgi:hypothetical protein